MLRPKDILDELAISPSSLRLWSTRFAELLSPDAQPSQTDKGGAAQRRYSPSDLELFRSAQRFLASGKTYEETRLALANQEPVPEAPEAPPAQESSTIDFAVIEPIHPIIRAFEEALKAKDQALASKDETIEAFHLVMKGKDHELLALQVTNQRIIHQLDQYRLTGEPEMPEAILMSRAKIGRYTPSQDPERRLLAKLIDALTRSKQDVG